MENVTRALIMAFSMIMFVIGFTYSMYLINKLTATSNVLLETITTTNYYDNIEIAGDKNQDLTTREVGVDTIIPILYRYYKENYAVKIVDGNEIVQVFDISLESKIHNAEGIVSDDKKGQDAGLIELKKSIYNNPENKAYLYGAPWVGNTDSDTKARIDYFVNGLKGYINNTLVDYSKNGFLNNYKDSTFIESFVEYAYEGQTISTAEGVETITGSTQENSKIIITYTKK